MKDIAELIREIVKGSLPLVCDFGLVTKVDEASFLCDIEIEGKSPVQDVRLFCGDYNSDAKGGGIVVIPEVGAQVLVIFFSKTIAFLLQCSKAKKIVFNGGELGGLVKIQELTDKLNELVDWCKNHKHTGVITAVSGGSGAPAVGTTGVSGTADSIPDKLNKDDFEDKNVIH